MVCVCMCGVCQSVCTFYLYCFYVNVILCVFECACVREREREFVYPGTPALLIGPAECPHKPWVLTGGLPTAVSGSKETNAF